MGGLRMTDTKFGNPGIPSVNVSNFTGIGAGSTNWVQFDTTLMTERRRNDMRLAPSSIRPRRAGSAKFVARSREPKLAARAHAAGTASAGGEPS